MNCNWKSEKNEREWTSSHNKKHIIYIYYRQVKSIRYKTYIFTVVVIITVAGECGAFTTEKHTDRKRQNAYQQQQVNNIKPAQKWPTWSSSVSNDCLAIMIITVTSEQLGWIVHVRYSQSLLPLTFFVLVVVFRLVICTSHSSLCIAFINSIVGFTNQVGMNNVKRPR